MSCRTTNRRRGAGSREDQGNDQQGSDQQEQPVSKLEPTLVLPCGIDQIAHGRKDNDWWFSSLNEVKQNGNARSDQPNQNPGVQETHQAIPDGWTSARRSAIPKGVSVVIR